MKRIIAALALLVLSAGVTSYAQTILINTTLSAALATGMTGQVATVTSATGITAPQTSNPANTTFLVIDAEIAQVVAVQGNQITLARGVAGTQGRPHAAGAVVLVLPANLATNFAAPLPTGSCTRTNQPALPVVTVNSSGVLQISDCLGGQWVTGDSSQTTRASQWKLQSPQIGAVTYAAAMGTSTATVAAELYCTEIDLQSSKLLTGLAPHVGATGGTDKWIAALYDSGGNPVAWSALAGTTAGTTQTWQQLAFTTPYYAVGPGQYYGCIMSNGTTATLDLITTGKSDFVLTYKSASAGTFGTLPTFTAPTGFTTVNGSYLYAY